MSDTAPAAPGPNPAPGALPPATPVPPARRPERRRRWPYVLLALVVVLAALVALLPTIASTGAARSAVLSQVNARFLAGKVDVADWSFGWTSGLSLRGIRVYDDKQSLVLEVARLTSDVTLLQAARGDLSLGRTRVEGLNANIVRHADGKLNVEHIAKVEPESEGSGSTSERDSSSPDGPSDGDSIDLPNLSGEIEIVDGRINLSGPDVPAVAVTKLNGTVKIPNVNAPIQNDLSLTATVDGGAPGTLTLAGTLSAIKNGQLALDTADGRQVVTVSGIDLGAVAPLLGEDAPISTLAGVTNGALTLALQSGKAATVDGKFTVAGLRASGPALQGDTYSSDAVEIVIPQTVVTMPNGPTDVDTMRVKTGSGPEQPITITLQQGRATAYADASLASVLRAIDGAAPGDTGRAAVEATFDVGQLAQQLPKTFKLVEGVTLTGGQFTTKSTVDITPDALALVSNTALTGVAGQNAVDNRAIALQPITVNLAAKAGGATTLLAGVRDVKLDLASAFANGSFAGPTLAGINGELTGALEKVQAELGQVIDFGTTKLAGAFVIKVTTEGDLANTLTTPATLSAGLTVNDLNVQGVKDTPPIVQRLIQGDLVAKVTTDEANAPRTIDVTTATLRTGDPNAPTLAADATATVGMKDKAIDVSAFQLKQFAADLAKLGAEFGEHAPELKNATGMLTASAAGDAQSSDAGLTAKLSQLALSHSDGLFNLTKAGDAPLAVAMPAGARFPQLTGTLGVDADLAKLSAFVKKLTPGTEVVAQTAAGEVRSGRVTGTINLARATNSQQDLSIDMVASGLSVTNADGRPVEFQPLTIALKAFAPDDLSTATLASASAKGDLLTADVSNVVVDLKTESKQPLDMVRSAEVSLAIPNLQPLYAVASAAFPPAPPAAGEEPAPPMAVAGGSFATKASLTRDAAGLPSLNVSQIDGRDIVVTNGASTYQIASISGTQSITPRGDTLAPKGQINVAGLKLLENGKQAFAEDQVAIANDLLIDLTKSDAVINALSVKMVSSGALSLDVKGAVRGWSAARQFENVNGTLAYDLEPLWNLLRPIAAGDPESLLAKAKLSGKVSEPFTLAGSLPANLPFHEAAKQLQASGAIAVPLLELEGSKLENFRVAATVSNGIATLASQPAPFNNGTLDVGGGTVDFTDAVATRLSMPKDKKLVANATLNPFLATNTLGKFVNPAFANPATASGLLDVTLASVDRLPLDAAVLKSAGPENDGSAEVVFTVRDLKLGNEVLGAILTATGNAATIDGMVRESRVTIARGVTTSDITIAAAQGGTEYPLRFAGSVRLSDQRLTPMNVSLLTSFLKGRGGDLSKYMPAEVTLPITGTTTKPELKIDQFIGQLVQGAVQKQLLDAVTGNKTRDEPTPPPAADGKPADPAATPAQAEPKKEEDPVQGLIDLFRDKDKEKDKEKERDRRKRKREAEGG